jgi:hypothetical protein
MLGNVGTEDGDTGTHVGGSVDVLDGLANFRADT